jgi:hypothetical protein
MSLTLSPAVYTQFFTDAGAPLSGGLLYTYVTGTSTPLTTYQNATGTTAFTNPIVLTAGGRIPASGALYLQNAAYQFYLTDSAGNPIGPNGGYLDPVTSTSLSSSSIGGAIFTFGGEQEAPITWTSYPTGTTYDTCHPDTAWWSIDAGTLIGSYALQAQMLSESGGIVNVALVNLTDGSPNTPLVTLSSTSATGERQISSTISFATAGSAKTYAIKSQVASGAGFAWSIAVIRTS